MKNGFAYLFCVFILSGITFVSCKKSSPYVNASVADTSLVVAKNSIAAYQTAQDISNTSEIALSASSSPLSETANTNNQPGLSTSGTSTTNEHVHYTGNFGDSITYTPEGLHAAGIFRSDFKSGILRDGITRSGAIINNFHHKYYQTGFIDSITFDKFTLNGNLISGLVILTRLSPNSFSRVFKITTSLNGLSVNIFNSSTVRTYNYNSGTAGVPVPLTYTFSETGTSSRHDGSSGTSDTSLIKLPLVYMNSCTLTRGRFPVSGSIDLSSSSSKKHRLIDYGTGNCDLIFTVTVGTTIKTITLSKI